MTPFHQGIGMGPRTAYTVLQRPKAASNGRWPRERVTCTRGQFDSGERGTRGHVAKAHSPDGQDHTGGRGEILRNISLRPLPVLTFHIAAATWM